MSRKSITPAPPDEALEELSVTVETQCGRAVTLVRASAPGSDRPPRSGELKIASPAEVHHDRTLESGRPVPAPRVW